MMTVDGIIAIMLAGTFCLCMLAPVGVAIYEILK